VYEKYLFPLKENVERGTNNFSDLVALFLLLKFSLHQGYDVIQVYGDSGTVINHVFGNFQLHNINLRMLENHSHDIIGLFA